MLYTEGGVDLRLSHASIRCWGDINVDVGPRGGDRLRRADSLLIRSPSFQGPHRVLDPRRVVEDTPPQRRRRRASPETWDWTLAQECVS